MILKQARLATLSVCLLLKRMNIVATYFFYGDTFFKSLTLNQNFRKSKFSFNMTPYTNNKSSYSSIRIAIEFISEIC